MKIDYIRIVCNYLHSYVSFQLLLGTKISELISTLAKLKNPQMRVLNLCV